MLKMVKPCSHFWMHQCSHGSSGITYSDCDNTSCSIVCPVTQTAEYYMPNSTIRSTNWAHLLQAIQVSMQNPLMID